MRWPIRPLFALSPALAVVALAGCGGSEPALNPAEPARPVGAPESAPNVTEGKASSTAIPRSTGRD